MGRPAPDAYNHVGPALAPACRQAAALQRSSAPAASSGALLNPCTLPKLQRRLAKMLPEAPVKITLIGESDLARDRGHRFMRFPQQPHRLGQTHLREIIHQGHAGGSFEDGV